VIIRAAAQATGCKLKLSFEPGTWDLRQNKSLGNFSSFENHTDTNTKVVLLAGEEVANVVLNKYGTIDYEWGIKRASTDFVNISFACSYPYSADQGIQQGNVTYGTWCSCPNISIHHL
jgi:hypothetical protein